MNEVCVRVGKGKKSYNLLAVRWFSMSEAWCVEDRVSLLLLSKCTHFFSKQIFLLTSSEPGIKVSLKPVKQIQSSKTVNQAT